MKRAFAVLAVLAVLALGSMACTRAEDPTAPSVIVDVDQTVIINPGGGPGTSPSPSPSPGAVVRVGIGVFGEGTCDPGKSIAGSERDNDLRQGCVAAITCSGFDAAGNEIFDTAITGGAPERFVFISGEGTVVRSSEQSNPYNLDVRGLAPGPAVAECVLKGVSSNASPRGPFRLTVVP